MTKQDKKIAVAVAAVKAAKEKHTKAVKVLDGLTRPKLNHEAVRRSIKQCLVKHLIRGMTTNEIADIVMDCLAEFQESEEY